MNIDPENVIAMALVIFFAIGLHEYAHCKFADMAGDPTPRIYGRVTLNLTKHFELWGTIMILVTAVTGVGIGWGKPSPMDASKMRNPRWDLFAAVAAGPISNLVQAVVWAIFARAMVLSGQVNMLDVLHAPFFEGNSKLIVLILFYGVFLNLSLAFFNLFPVAPLDGHWLVGLLLPERARDKWFYYSRRYGWYVLLALVFAGQLSNGRLSIFRLASPLIQKIAELLFGVRTHP